MTKIRSHRVFFGMAIAGIAALSLFVYLMNRQLTDELDPKANVVEFFKYNKWLTVGTFIVYLFLLFTANIMYVRERYWDTFIWAGIVFVAFTLIDWWWLGEKLFRYKKDHELWMGEFSLGPFLGIMIALLGLGVAIGNYMVLKRMVKDRKHHPDLNKQSAPLDEDRLFERKK